MSCPPVSGGSLCFLSYTISCERLVSRCSPPKVKAQVIVAQVSILPETMSKRGDSSKGRGAASFSAVQAGKLAQILRKEVVWAVEEALQKRSKKEEQGLPARYHDKRVTAKWNARRWHGRRVSWAKKMETPGRRACLKPREETFQKTRKARTRHSRKRQGRRQSKAGPEEEEKEDETGSRASNSRQMVTSSILDDELSQYFSRVVISH